MRFQPLTLALASMVAAYTVVIAVFWLVYPYVLDWLDGLLIGWPWVLLVGKVYLDWRDVRG